MNAILTDAVNYLIAAAPCFEFNGGTINMLLPKPDGSWQEVEISSANIYSIIIALFVEANN